MIKQTYLILLLLILAVGCAKESFNDKTADISNRRDRGNERGIDYNDYLDFDVDCVKQQIQTGRTSTKDKLKYSLSKFFAEKFQDEQIKSTVLNLIRNSGATSTKGNTVFLADLLQVNVTGVGATFEELLNQYYAENFPEEIGLLETLCSTNWDIVIQMPWWGDEIITKSNLDVLTQEYSIVPAVEPVICNGVNSRIGFIDEREFVIKTDELHIGYIPLYIKKVEHFPEYDLDATSELMQVFSQVNEQFGNCTFTLSDLGNFVKGIDCANIQAVDVISFLKFANDYCTECGNGMTVGAMGGGGDDDECEEICDNGIDDNGDGYIDCDDMLCDCIEICGNGIDDDQDGEIDEEDCIEDISGEICDNYIDDDGDGLIDAEDEEDCPCLKNCQRDCIVESNVLKAVKFGGGGYNRACQTHDEATIELEYTFSAVDMCDENSSDQCLNLNLHSLEAGKDLNYLTGDNTSAFFEMQQTHRVHKDDRDEFNIYVGQNGIVYVAKDPDDSNWWIYWKAYPKYVPINFRYLSGTAQNNWNGDLIGNVIQVTVYELDNNNVTTTESRSVTSSVSTTYSASANANISLSKFVSIGARSSYTFRSSVTNRQSYTRVKRYLMDIFLQEFNLLYCDEDNFVPDPTGVEGNSWYGHIPQVTDPDGPNGPLFLYHEFRVVDEF